MAYSAEPRPPGPIQLLTTADAGRSMGLRIGGKFEVALAGNPTTGFQWDVANSGMPIIKLSGEPKFEPSRDALGAGGRFIFRFEAVAVGQTALKLIYHRPFEKDTPPAETFELTVTVK